MPFKVDHVIVTAWKFKVEFISGFMEFEFWRCDIFRFLDTCSLFEFSRQKLAACEIAYLVFSLNFRALEANFRSLNFRAKHFLETLSYK